MHVTTHAHMRDIGSGVARKCALCVSRGARLVCASHLAHVPVANLANAALAVRQQLRTRRGDDGAQGCRRRQAFGAGAGNARRESPRAVALRHVHSSAQHHG